MIRMSKVKVNGLEYLSVTWKTLMDLKTIQNKDYFLKKHNAKTLGVKILLKEIRDKVNYKYIYKDIGNYIYIYISEIDKLKELFGDIEIECDGDDGYSDVDNMVNCVRCEKCNGIILNSYNYDGNAQDLCCHNYSFEDVYNMLHTYPKIYKYENATLSETNKEELKAFSDEMTKNNINSYRVAYKELGKVIFRVVGKYEEKERIERIINSVDQEIKEISISDKVVNVKAIDMILKHKISSIIEQLLLDKLVDINGLEIIPQYTIDMFVVDFFVKYKDVSLVIECDGEDYHSITKDHPRQRYIQIKGYDIIRFTGKEIVNDIEMCIRQIISYMVAIHNKKDNVDNLNKD